MEKQVGPMPFDHACKYLSNLIKESKAFIGGSKPVIGRLKTSYGYKKVIGIISFDHKVRTRIDYDSFKGYHFNFENDQTKEKTCIMINDMSKDQYERYIDTLSKGRGIIPTPKRPNIQYQQAFKLLDSKTAQKYISDTKTVNKVSRELAQDKFIIDYYIELVNMFDNYEIELSIEELKEIRNQMLSLKDKIDDNLFYLESFIEYNGIELDMNYYYELYSFDLNKDNNPFRK